MLKKSLIFPFFFLFLCPILRGQSQVNFDNLVVNPSFETLDVKAKNKILVADSLERIVGWKSASIGRAEIYNTDENHQ